MAVDHLGNVRVFRSAVDHATAGRSRTVCISRLSTTTIISTGFRQSTSDSFVVRRGLTTATGGKRQLERVPKVSIEQSVDERIQRRVDVSDPEQNGDDERRRCGTEFSAQRVVDVPGEERKPAAKERSHDDAECLRRFIFTPHLSTLRSLTVWNGASLHRRRIAERHVASFSQIKTVDRRPNRRRQRLNELGLSLSGAEDAQIGEDHNDRREPK